MGIKLLYITNGITGSGGLERVLSIKASLLADEFGYEVHILSLNEADTEAFFSFSKRIIRHSVKVGGNPLQYLWQYCKGLRNKVKEIGPDVISVCDDGLKGFLIPKILGNSIPVIYERHASVLLNNSPCQHWIMKQLSPSFIKFIVLTPGSLKDWPADNTAVIPNPVSFYPKHSAELAAKRVIAVGSHSYNKGYDLLLNIWKKIEADFPDWQLDIYGKYKDDTVQKLAQTLHLKKVYFYPPVSNIEEKFLESSVLVFPSRSEGFGMVIIEAMACGLPIVSFDCPHGPADIITDGTDGFLISNGNVEMFSRRLNKLMSNHQLRIDFGTNGKITSEMYLSQNILEKWDELFKILKKEINNG